MLSVRDLRIFVAVPRTASTLFMRIMAQNPEVGVTSRNILMGKMQPRPADPAQPRPFEPDYSIFEPGHPIYEIAAKMGKRVIVSKEEFGNDRSTGNERLNECNFLMFPNAAAIRATKPVFGFRKPEHAFDSWLSKGWTDLESFLLVYKTDLKTFQTVQAINPGTVFYTLEYMVRNRLTQTNVFKRICEYWGIPFSPRMLTFRDKFGENFLYRDERERGIYASNPRGLFDDVIGAKGIRRDLPHPGLIQPHQAARIAAELGPAYEAIHRATCRLYEGTQRNLPKRRGAKR